MLFNRVKLSNFMKQNDITNVALARQLGVSEGVIRHIVIGTKQPSLAMAYQIAKIMTCTIDELIEKGDE